MLAENNAQISAVHVAHEVQPAVLFAVRRGSRDRLGHRGLKGRRGHRGHRVGKARLGLLGSPPRRCFA